LLRVWGFVIFGGCHEHSVGMYKLAFIQHTIFKHQTQPAQGPSRVAPTHSNIQTFKHTLLLCLVRLHRTANPLFQHSTQGRCTNPPMPSNIQRKGGARTHQCLEPMHAPTNAWNPRPTIAVPVAVAHADCIPKPRAQPDNRNPNPRTLERSCNPTRNLKPETRAGDPKG
jgi:hypothetical protein